MKQAEWYSVRVEGYGLQVRKKRAVNNKPTGTPSGSSAAQDPVTKKPAGMTSSSSAAPDPAAGAMIVEEPVGAEEEQEEESEEQEFLREDRAHQDDTGFQNCPACAEIAALYEEEDEEDDETYDGQSEGRYPEPMCVQCPG